MKIIHGLLGLTLALGIGTGYAQDQAQDEKKELPEAAADGQQTAETARAGKDRNPQTGKELKGIGEAARLKGGKALAETVKATAGPPDFIDDDDDGDGIGDATEQSAAHEATHTVQQSSGAEATERKALGRTKTADVTLKKSDKKKGDNH